MFLLRLLFQSKFAGFTTIMLISGRLKAMKVVQTSRYMGKVKSLFSLFSIYTTHISVLTHHVNNIRRPHTRHWIFAYWHTSTKSHSSPALGTWCVLVTRDVPPLLPLFLPWIDDCSLLWCWRLFVRQLELLLALVLKAPDEPGLLPQDTSHTRLIFSLTIRVWDDNAPIWPEIRFQVKHVNRHETKALRDWIFTK